MLKRDAISGFTGVRSASFRRGRTTASTSIAKTLIVVLTLTVSLASLHCERGEGEVERNAPRDAPERMAAASRGIDWLLAHADEMPPGWAHLFLLRVHRVAPDDETAARIEAVLRDDASPSRRFALPPNFEDPRILQPFRMTPILFELNRRKAVGEAYRDDLEAVRKAIEGQGRLFWDKVKPLQRIVYLHLFEDLGLTAPYDFDSIYTTFRSELAARSTEDVAEDPQALYTLTHLIIFRSMYFRNHVEASEFDLMLPYMRRALSTNLGATNLGATNPGAANPVEGSTTSRLDISAEILACLSLMRTPDDDEIAAARRILVAAQNPDGSWGEPSVSTRKRSHATMVGVLGTIVFPEDLRSDPDLKSRP